MSNQANPLNLDLKSSAPLMNPSDLRDMTINVDYLLSRLKNTRKFCNQLKAKISAGNFSTMPHGMSLLDVKSQMLLQYCSRLCLYISSRAKGESVAESESLKELAMLSWLMERVRRVQKQCQYSIDKLLEHWKKTKMNKEAKAGQSRKPDVDDIRFSSDEEPEEDEDEDDEDVKMKAGDGVRGEARKYKVLKKNPALMEDEGEALTRREMNKIREAKKKVRDTELYSFIKEDITNMPKTKQFHLRNLKRFEPKKEEEEEAGEMQNERVVMRSRKRIDDITEYEENTMKRLPGSRAMIKELIKKEKFKESKHNYLNMFVNNIGRDLQHASRLADYAGGGSYYSSIGKIERDNKKKRIKINGPVRGWRHKAKILHNRTKLGKRQLRRKKWRKAHPFKHDPNKDRNKRKNKSAKVKKLLKKM